MKRKSITPVWCTPAETMPRTATDRTTELPGSPQCLGEVLDFGVKRRGNGLQAFRAFGFGSLGLRIENVRLIVFPRRLDLERLRNE